MKKTLMIMLALVLVIAMSVTGTLAYLTADDAVTNTFSIGNVTITLDEAKVGEDGKAITGTGADRVHANSYKLIPGTSYDKDPIIHVDKESEKCYLFVTVDNAISGLEDADKGTIAAQMQKNGWEQIDGTIAWKYVGEGEKPVAVVSAGANVEVFEKLHISGNADISGADGDTISVHAYAVQAENLTQNEAWDAIKAKVFPAA